MPSLQIGPNARPYSYTTTIGFSLTAFLIFLAIIYGQKSAESQITFTDSPFEFHVYCPISSKDYLKQYANLIANAKIKQLKSKDIQEDIYVVYVKARPNDKTPNATAGLYYCGLARPWLGSCQDAKIICSSPGPMFYMRSNSPAYIIWVNDIDTKGLNWLEEDCFSPDSDDQFCTIDSRLKASKPSQLGCAYKDPTNLNYKSSSVRIDRNHVPISTHLHGLSTRPVFDGNPLSWFDNSGNLGVGYYSLDDPEYFQQFAQVQSFYQMPQKLMNKNIKINYALNAQPAGHLFYHDHAMRSTKYNVKNGLTGLYIIYDEQIQKTLPPIDHEKFIVFSAAIDGDARENLSQMKMKSKKKGHHRSHKGHVQKIYTLNVADVFERNSLYRLRVLNGHFDNIFTSISFSVYYKEQVNKNGRKVITEIDPSNITFNLTENQHNINFTMIGADSAIFHKFIPNVKSFDLGVAERVELLIRFDEASGVPKGVQYYYLTCDDGNADGKVIKYKFKLTRESESSKGVMAIPTGSKNPYKDLSLIDSKSIVMKRMRPLLSLPRDEKFVINGHYMFEMGASDNPQIGTVEDWYFINTLFEGHPIHFHQVNFQVVQTFSLKMVQEECTLFEVDYLRSSGYSKFKTFTDTQLCDYITNNITSAEAEEVFALYNQLYLEDQNRNTAKFGKVSGFNVLQLVGKQNIVTNSNCSLGNVYKYLCQETSSTIPKHYRRWKDTALINPFSVSVLRIRWTMTEYDEKTAAYPYFNIPQDELMEFPGFVYHCHILPHEDNEMMRPYMLRPSDVYVKSIESKLKTQGIPCNKSSISLDWSDKQKKINAKLGCKDYP